jgi:hypothetical protein
MLPSNTDEVLRPFWEAAPLTGVLEVQVDILLYSLSLLGTTCRVVYPARASAALSSSVREGSV